MSWQINRKGGIFTAIVDGVSKVFETLAEAIQWLFSKGVK